MKAQTVLLLAVCALLLSAAPVFATEATVDESGYPPVVFTYNATTCMSCRTQCVLANPGPAKKAARKACKANCNKQEYCMHYVPVEYKPESAQQIIVLNSTEFQIPVAPPVEYHTVDFSRGPNVGEFFQKLREYIKWKDAQENNPYQPPAEYKGEDSVVTLIPVGATPDPGSHIPEFGDLEPKPLLKGRKPRGKRPAKKPKKPTPAPTPAPAPAPVPPSEAPATPAPAPPAAPTPAVVTGF